MLNERITVDMGSAVFTTELNGLKVGDGLWSVKGPYTTNALLREGVLKTYVVRRAYVSGFLQDKKTGQIDLYTSEMAFERNDVFDVEKNCSYNIDFLDHDWIFTDRAKAESYRDYVLG